MNTKLLSVIVALLTACRLVAFAAQTVPVVLDTDIGDDIDDTWALAILLHHPELDLKLVTTTFGKAEYRAKIVARLLTIAHRTDVPVGLGAGGHGGTGGQQPWVQDYKLESYPGPIKEDGVQALIDTVNRAEKPITIISIGPSDTVAAALQRQPDIATKAYFVGMQGSVRKGYDGGPVCPEWNVKANIAAAQKALLAPWKKVTITPLDTCGLVKVSGARYAELTRSQDPLTKAVLENYRIWAKKDQLSASSVLFDTVAVYLATPGAKSLLKLEDLNINVSPSGLTTIDDLGRPMAVATSWNSLDGYEDWVVSTLTGKAASAQSQ